VMTLLKAGPLAVREGGAVLGHVTADGVLARLLDPRA
jgi:glycine betaine/proline transport system ATP-binding protein